MHIKVQISVPGFDLKNGMQFGGESLLVVATCNACGLEEEGGGGSARG